MARSQTGERRRIREQGSAGRRRWSSPHSQGRAGVSDLFEALIAIAEVAELFAHPVEQWQIQSASPPIVVVGVQIVEHLSAPEIPVRQTSKRGGLLSACCR